MACSTRLAPAAHRASKKEADAPEWQAAIEALILVADLGGPTMFARIGIMRALNRHHVREFNPSRIPLPPLPLPRNLE